jgi:dTDP-4-amino-4,6-dideoxygalactose transaminase
MTTGGGGMILTDDEQLAEKARYLTTQAKDDMVRYIHHEIGYNFRLTNIQAALGVAQLEQLPMFLKRKQEIFNLYQTKLEEVEGLTIANSPEYANNNHWMNILQINSEVYGIEREDLLQRLDKNGIQTRPVWALNHLQKPYRNCQKYKIEHATELIKKTLCLPSSTNLTNADIHHVLNHLGSNTKN